MNNLVEVKDNKISVAEDVVKKIRSLEEVRIEAEMTMKELKEELIEAMESNGITDGFETNGLKVIYKKPSTRTTLDSKKVKEELPDIFEKYSKTSEVKSSVSLEFLW